MATNVEKWQVLTEKRDARLASCDWTALSDVALSDSKKAEWAAYRQALRDIPNGLRANSGYVSDSESDPYVDCGDYTWPTKPS